eukprot:CAMPEP_0172418434 /NCGR_PEP_ID=MMETSP1064-20121228/4929_1 /TAXON_ID=202472 /ORGANISM="Aulacoseira subarctica , Strain CCAP 1002/5" /LENGTH=825 /DNA_ID=CAMNT_0013157375 /DNA_START=446 /DNA_END=2923 /DNA_ORIENTATION=-
MKITCFHVILLLLVLSIASVNSAGLKGGNSNAKHADGERRAKKKLARGGVAIQTSVNNASQGADAVSLYSNVIELAKTYMASAIQVPNILGATANVEEVTANDFVVKDVMKDIGTDGTDTMVHVRLERLYKGLRVFGGDAVVHIKANDSSLSSISSTMTIPIKIDTSEISSIQSSVSGNSKELVIFAHQDVPTLAWDLTKHGTASDQTPMEVHYIMDAKTGKQLFQFSDTKTLRPTGWPDFPLSNEKDGTPDLEDIGILAILVPPFCSSAPESIGIGHTQYSGKVNLSTFLSDGMYSLWDTKRLCHYTLDANQTYASYYDDFSFFDEITDNIWGDGTNASRNTAAADAHFGHAASFDFYHEKFGRLGVYNNRQKSVYSIVHFGFGYANAYWYKGKMTYGDGDGIDFGPLTTLDVAAHELTHGVTEATAGLIYWGESGGLNEATSDIMGVAVDFYATDRSDYKPNYLIGEQIILKPFCNNSLPVTNLFLRSLINPSDDSILYCNQFYAAGSYDCYCPEVGEVDVHFSSGVANHFFYLLAEGTINGKPSRTCDIGDCQIAKGSDTLVGIGIEKAQAIWYRALTTYFTPWTDYPGAREATILAASDLFTPVEIAAVEDAWRAVNVLPPPPPTMSPSMQPSKSSAPTTFTAKPTMQFTLFELDLQTDYFPSETSWILKRISPSNETIAERDFDYYLETKIYNETVKLYGDGKYEFTIFDSFGDGLSMFDGFYLLKLDEDVVKVGGELGVQFNFSETYSFSISTKSPIPSIPTKVPKKPSLKSPKKPSLKSPAKVQTPSTTTKQTKKPKYSQNPPSMKPTSAPTKKQKKS